MRESSEGTVNVTPFFDLAPEDFSRLGEDPFASTYLDDKCYPEGPGCPQCGIARQQRVGVLVMEWEAGSDVVADFTFLPVLEFIVVTERVRSFFEKNRFTGLKFGSVSMIQHSTLQKPLRPNKKTKKRIWLPYEGPPLWELIITSHCRLNLEKSRWKLLKQCDSCGAQEFDEDKGRGLPWEQRLVVDKSDWAGSDFFRIDEHPNVYVTQRAAAAIHSAGFSNVKVGQVGTIR